MSKLKEERFGSHDIYTNTHYKGNFCVYLFQFPTSVKPSLMLTNLASWFRSINNILVCFHNVPIWPFEDSYKYHVIILFVIILVTRSGTERHDRCLFISNNLPDVIQKETFTFVIVYQTVWHCSICCSVYIKYQQFNTCVTCFNIPIPFSKHFNISLVYHAYFGC